MLSLENFIAFGWLGIFSLATVVLGRANTTLKACTNATEKLGEAVSNFNNALSDLREEIRDLRGEVRELRDYNEIRSQAIVKERHDTPLVSPA